MSKYFKYAIGEILLVMIGILLALQVNNWNQQKNNEATLAQFLKEFRDELQLNISDFKEEIERINRQLEQKNTLLKNTRLDTISLDTLENHIITKYILAGHNPSLLKRLENAQITDFGKFDSIFGNLQEFYGFQWPNFNVTKDWHNNEVDREDAYWRHGQNSYELKLSSGDSGLWSDSNSRKNELMGLLQTPLVRNMLKSDYYRKKNIKPQIEYYIITAEKHLQEINNILK